MCPSTNKIYAYRIYSTPFLEGLLNLIPLTWRIWWAPNNGRKWQMGFNSEFTGLKSPCLSVCAHFTTGNLLQKFTCDLVLADFTSKGLTISFFVQFVQFEQSLHRTTSVFRHVRVRIHILCMRSFYASDPFVSLFWASPACHARFFMIYHLKAWRLRHAPLL